MIKTSEFLKYFPGYYIQTFCDRGLDKSLTTCGQPHTYSIPKLTELNRKGAGIFFTPNKFSERRKADKCEKVNAWFFEMDTGTFDEQWEKVTSAPLMPSLVVKTAKSLHCYFLSDGAASIDEFREIQCRLIQYFDADKACKDISRVFRIPGFLHMKSDPVMVEVIWNEGVRYSEELMLEKFPAFVPDESIQNPIRNDTIGDDFWTRAVRLDNKQVLLRASGSSFVNGETFTFKKRTSGGEYIEVNGKVCNAWIDEVGQIGSGNGGGPTYIQWFEYYSRSKAEIAEWLKENYPELKCENPKHIDLTSDVLMDEMGELLNQKFDLTWGTEKLDRAFSPLTPGKYVLVVGETGAGKTVWAFDMALKNARLGKKVLYLSLEMKNAHLILRYALNKLNLTKTDFRKKNYDVDAINAIVQELPSKLVLKKVDGIPSIESLETIVREGEYDMVFIDNLGFLDADADTELVKVEKISRAIVRLREETNTVIIALHHFRKNSGSSGGFRGLDAVRGSGKITHDLDFAIEVMRNPEEEDASKEQKAELSVMLSKDRDWGDRQFRTIYYQNGEFGSEYDHTPKNVQVIHWDDI